MKRGQISLFVITGILILILLGLAMLIPEYLQKGESLDDSSAFRFVESCLSSTATEGLKLQGVRGGWLYDPKPQLELGSGTAAYYDYYSGSKYAPTLQEMQQDIADYVDSHIGDCLSAKGMDSHSNVNVASSPEFVTISMSNPTTVRSGNGKVTKDEYSVQIDVPLGKIAQSADALIESITASDLNTDTRFDKTIGPYLKPQPCVGLAFMATPINTMARFSYYFYSCDTTIWHYSQGDYNFIFAARHMRK